MLVVWIELIPQEQSTLLFQLSRLVAPAVRALGPLPGLSADEKDEDGDEDDGPLPGNAVVHEDDVVEDGDVEGGEDEDEDDGDGPEEEVVVPEVGGPRADAPGHVEERPPRVDQLPREEQEDPRDRRVARRPGPEYTFARPILRVRRVAVPPQVAVEEPE